MAPLHAVCEQALRRRGFNGQHVAGCAVKCETPRYCGDSDRANITAAAPGEPSFLDSCSVSSDPASCEQLAKKVN